MRLISLIALSVSMIGKSGRASSLHAEKMEVVVEFQEYGKNESRRLSSLAICC